MKARFTDTKNIIKIPKSRLFVCAFFLIELFLLKPSYCETIAKYKPTAQIKSNSESMAVKMWGDIARKESKFIKNIAILVDNGNFTRALSKIEPIKKSDERMYYAFHNIILWHKYNQEDYLKKLPDDVDKSLAFKEMSTFVFYNEYFPDIDDIQSNLEKLTVVNNIAASDYEEYFLKKSPKSKDAKIYLLEGKIESLKNYSGSFFAKEDKIKEIRLLVADIWINGDFSDEEEAVFLEKYYSQLTAIDHIARINRLLWKNNYNSVENILKLIDVDHQKLFLAIIKIGQNPKYINNIILSVPRRLRGDEHLQYRRAIFYNLHDKPKELVKLLPTISKDSQYSAKWWKLRHIYGRELMKDRKYKEAYQIISSHGLDPEGYEFVQAEWVAGWIALRFLDKPKLAVKHFKNMHDNVSYPISVSRAVYWLGMSFDAMGNKKEAKKWYKIASKYPTYFYGQVAIHKYRNMDEVSLANFVLPKVPEISENDIEIIAKKTALQVAYLLALTNDKQVSLKIFKGIIENLNSKGKIAAIIKLVEEIGDDELTHKLYRFANRKNVFFIDKQFKVIRQIKSDPNAALIHALIKQESGFSQSAKSSVGAIGFMQIMPGTAKQVARKLKIRYSKYKLENNIKYNVKIGSYYIDSLLKKFDGSKILAIASYNAGPNRTKLWMEEFYDPRDFNSPNGYDNNDLDKVVDWVELITYGETRNYVQRVMENLLVYNYLLLN